ncbi:MAG: STAS domain-containing protein [Gammaproteobacteria bacterium]|nr:STAS domain-containing protein [Gammaproteobacteria bacterium]
MSDAAVRRGADDRLVVEGELDFTTVARLREAAKPLLGVGADVRVDLQGITRSDSAGLALLVDWMRAAQRLGKPIQFLNIPPQMLAIARVSSLDQVLPLSRG